MGKNGRYDYEKIMEIIWTKGRYMRDKINKSEPWVKLVGFEILTRGSEGFSF